MHGITLLLVAAIGVDVGWKPAENGELEYIIQIAPEQLQSLKTGDEIEVGVRPMLRSVRRYRIVVGTDPLPRQRARPALENAPPDPEANQSAAVVVGAVVVGAVVVGAVVVGAICGILGGVFVLVNSNLGILRKKYIKANWMKLLEAVCFSIMTTTTFYWFPCLINDCQDSSDVLSSTDAEIVV